MEPLRESTGVTTKSDWKSAQPRVRVNPFSLSLPEKGREGGPGRFQVSPRFKRIRSRRLQCFTSRARVRNLPILLLFTFSFCHYREEKSLSLFVPAEVSPLDSTKGREEFRLVQLSKYLFSLWLRITSLCNFLATSICNRHCQA